MSGYPKIPLRFLQQQFDTIYAGLTLLELANSGSVPVSLHSGALVTNRGASGAVVAALPSAADLGTGLPSWPFRALSYALRIDPGTAENLRYSGGAMAAGEYLELAAESSCIVTWDGTEWIVTAETGTLTEETP